MLIWWHLRQIFVSLLHCHIQPNPLVVHTFLFLCHAGPPLCMLQMISNSGHNRIQSGYLPKLLSISAGFCFAQHFTSGVISEALGVRPEDGVSGRVSVSCVAGCCVLAACSAMNCALFCAARSALSSRDPVCMTACAPVPLEG